jgi:hypothetical protein
MRTHGMHGTPTYKSWVRMKQRCLDKNSPDYEHYGARGITVCRRWMKFENFYADMGERQDGLTLERKNNSIGYEPDNCMWGSRREQSVNRSITKWITYKGETLCMTDWARRVGLTKHRLSQRLIAGWPIEKALTPLRKYVAAPQ